MNTLERSFSRAYLRSFERLMGFLTQAQDNLAELEKRQLDPENFKALTASIYKIEDEFVLFEMVRNAELPALSD